MIKRLIGSFVLVLAVAACTSPAVDLQVTAVNPVPDAVDVSVDTVVSATFNRPVDPITVDGAFGLAPSGGGTAVAGALSYNAATRTASFTPASGLDYDTEYVVSVSGTVATPTGSLLGDAFEWSFTTEADPDPAEIDGVTVSPATAILAVGEDVQLEAVVSVVGGSPSTAVTWGSSNNAVATVAADGLVTAVGVGSAVVTATSVFDADFSGSATINVVATDAIDGVTVSPATATLVVGDDVQLDADVTIASGSPSTAVTWESDDDAVATVDGDGLVTAIGAGTATITATSVFDADFSGSATITVVAADAIDGVTVSPATATLVVGDDVQLDADVTITSGSPSTAVTWESDDDAVATVDGDGLVTAIGAGTATITATSVFDGSFSDSAVVTVVAPIEVVGDYAPYAAEANVDTPISIAFPAFTGGLAPFAFEILAGALPDDFVTQDVEFEGVPTVLAATYAVELDPDTGEIAGSTGFPGVFTGTVQVTDALGQTATVDFELDLDLAFRYVADDLVTTATTFSYPSDTIPYFIVPGIQVQVSGVGDTDGLPEGFLSGFLWSLSYVSSNVAATPAEQDSFAINTGQGAITRLTLVPSITQWIYDVDLVHTSGKTAEVQVRFHEVGSPFVD